MLEKRASLKVLSIRRTCGGRLYFKTNHDTLADYLAYRAPVLAPSEKPIIKNYHEVLADIPEDSQLSLLWARKAAA